MSTKQVKEFETFVEIPEKVNVSLKKNMLKVEGPIGKTFKNFKKIPVTLQIKDRSVHIKAQGTKKRDFAILNTAKSIIKTLCEGVIDGYTIKMKIVFAHFPITVKTENKLVLIDNFQGERAPRTAKILGNTKVIPKGDDVTVTGHVLTDVTQTAANIQQNTIVKNKDHRVFLDGIYIKSKTKGMEK